jgi:hypothetical protein
MREESRIAGESTDDGMADAFCEGWRCPGAGHTPYDRAEDIPDEPWRPLRRVALAAQKTRGQSLEPRTCPFAALYATAHPLVDRVVEGFAGLDEGLSDRTAFPGGVTAVDHVGLRVYRRGRAARQHSDDAIRERERKQRETEAAAAAKPR